MHKVLASHIEAFKANHSLTLAESKLFEAFAAFTICSHFCVEEVEPESLVYDGADPGIDTVMFFVNEKCIITLEEIEEVFKSKKNDNEVVIAVVQSTTRDSWDKQKLNTLESALMDFISDEPNHIYSEYIQEKKQIFDNIIANLGKVKGGKPAIYAYYASSAGSEIPKEIESARRAIEAQLTKSGFFTSSTAVLMDWDRLVREYVASTSNYEAKFPIIGSASFPKSPGIEEGYVVTVAAKRFAQAVLRDDQGNLRRMVFEENVRDFITFAQSPINTAMRESLVDPQSTKRFGILNNGIAIISPDVRLQSNEIFIANYQIVNGCQTSSVLFDALDEIDDNTTLMVKLIETSNQEIVDEIVETTNSQNKIDDHQFLARLDCVKSIEKYFRARVDEPDQVLYFERRPNQYNSQTLPAIRIFNIKEAARCCGAMFFDRPDLSARYPGQLVEELSEKVFNKSNKEEIFYASAYAYYRLKLHLSNQRIDPIFNLFKWHALMAVKYIVGGAAVPSVTSPKIEQICAEIIKFMSRTDAEAMKKWKELSLKLKALPHANRDDARRFRTNAELRQLLIGG